MSVYFIVLTSAFFSPCVPELITFGLTPCCFLDHSFQVLTALLYLCHQFCQVVEFPPFLHSPFLQLLSFPHCLQHCLFQLVSFLVACHSSLHVSYSHVAPFQFFGLTFFTWWHVIILYALIFVVLHAVHLLFTIMIVLLS